MSYNEQIILHFLITTTTVSTGRYGPFCNIGIYSGAVPSLPAWLPIEIGSYKMKRAYGTHSTKQCLFDQGNDFVK